MKSFQLGTSLRWLFNFRRGCVLEKFQENLWLQVMMWKRMNNVTLMPLQMWSKWRHYNYLDDVQTMFAFRGSGIGGGGGSGDTHTHTHTHTPPPPPHTHTLPAWLCFGQSCLYRVAQKECNTYTINYFKKTRDKINKLCILLHIQHKK